MDTENTQLVFDPEIFHFEIGTHHGKNIIWGQVCLQERKY
jgi:hypothetical protein